MKQRTKMKRICSALCFAALLLSVFSSRGFAGEETAKAAVPKLEISETSHDAGKVKQGTKSVKHVFTVKNKGTGDLNITSVTAS
jgi:hypothetical protein